MDGGRLVASAGKVKRFTGGPRRDRAVLSAVGEVGITGVTVECVDIWMYKNAEGMRVGRFLRRGQHQRGVRESS